MKITNFVSLLIGMVGVLWLGIAGWYGAEWYEHRPHGEPSWAKVHWLWFSWSPPDSLAAQRDLYKARVDLLMINQAKLQTAIADQNAAVARLELQGRLSTAAGETAVRANESRRRATAAASTTIRALPVDAKATCPALKPTDDAFVAFLRTQQ